ncbi:sugar phosphate nucleotidyltransferase [Bradyrhizobium sp. CB3481]|uniref:sugar phosphate nucleotidyltransferase n=1 Tax=Bradyrhizobium sp. CB3481 TaxID=3039158 RepID=UPI0032C2479D
MASNAPKKAVILAAGLGSRLRPLTDLLPKPLLKINGTPILQNALRNLESIARRGGDDRRGLPERSHSICLWQPLWRA